MDTHRNLHWVHMELNISTQSGSYLSDVFKQINQDSGCLFILLSPISSSLQFYSSI